MKPLSIPVITASLTAMITLALIAVLFLIPADLVPASSAMPAPNITNSVAKSPRLPARNKTAPARLLTTAMTLNNLDAIITRLDNKVEKTRTGFWRFTIEGASVVVVGDKEHDRLRILVGIRNAKGLRQRDLARIAKSNFDTALDARYAISQDVLWAIYVHPIKSLKAKQFISALGQTVNLAKSYGDGYSSGGILFDGGDKKDASRHRLIELLMAVGLPA